MAEPLTPDELAGLRARAGALMCTAGFPVRMPYYLVERLLATITEAQRREAVVEERLNSAHDVIRWLADGQVPMNEDAQEEYLLATGQDWPDGTPPKEKT